MHAQSYLVHQHEKGGGRDTCLLDISIIYATVVVAPLEALPRGPGFDPPRGRISALGLKKLPRLSHVQSTVEPGLTHKATGPRVRVGQGFGGFLGLL